MSDTDSDSEVQINVRPNRNNVIRDESLDEGSNYESQNEEDFEQPSLSNANAYVSSPLDPVRIHTSQSEPSDTVARVPRSQGSATPVDNPGRRVDVPGRRSPSFNVGIPDQHSNATHPRVDIPGRRSPPFNVGIPDQHSSATYPRVDIPGRRSPAFSVDNPDQHSNATHPQVDIPGRRQRSPVFSVDNSDQHSNATYPRVDIPGRRRRSPGYNVAFQEQQSSYQEIPVGHNDRYPDKFSHCKFDSAGRSRASNRYEPADCRKFGTSLGYRSSTGISAATLRTFSRDRESPGLERRTGSPSPHYYRPRRRSRHQTRNFRDTSKRYYSPYSRRHKSFDYERPVQSPGRGDINQSNRISMPIPHGRPDYRESYAQRFCPDLEPYINDPYESVPDYEQRRHWTEFGDEHVHYQSPCQIGPRIKPESYSGNEDWEEYQSHFEDCAELSRWDHRSKVLFLAASLKGHARTYYMSLDTCDKRSYSALVYKMRQRFGGSKHAIKWLNQLELRQRQPKESIVALGDDLRQLARKAYRNLDSNAQETLALNRLYKLIPVEMKCRCMDYDCQSIHQAIEVIERYEAILGEAGQDHKKSSLRSIDIETEDQNNDPCVAGILRKLDSRLEKLESLSLAQQITGRENIENQRRKAGYGNMNKRCCFFCSSPDHLVKNCPEITRQGSKQRYQGKSNGALQGNSVPQNSAWHVPQFTAQQINPHFPVQLPPFNFLSPNAQENGKLSAQ